MKVLVIGGTGFIGSKVAALLHESDFDVSIVNRHLQPLPPQLNTLKRYIVDWTSSENIADVLRLGFDVVIHTASSTVPQTSNNDPVFDLQSNLIPFVNLLEYCRRFNVAKIVFASSGGTVYGLNDNTLIDEKQPTDPICSYGIVKLAMEKYLGLYRRKHQLKYVALRIANAYGPGQNPEGIQGVVAVFTKRILHQEDIQIWGSGETIRDYVYIDDVARAFKCAIRHEVEGVFNIGSGEGVSLNQLIKLLELETKLSARIHYLKSRNFDVDRVILSNSKAQQILQWYPEKLFADGLAQTVAWCNAGN